MEMQVHVSGWEEVLTAKSGQACSLEAITVCP